MGREMWKNNILLKEDNKKKIKIKKEWRKKEEKMITLDHKFNGIFNDFVLFEDALFARFSKEKESGEKEKDTIAAKEVIFNYINDCLHVKGVDEVVDEVATIQKMDFDSPRFDKENDEEEDSPLLKEEIRKLEKLFEGEMMKRKRLQLLHTSLKEENL